MRELHKLLRDRGRALPEGERAQVAPERAKHAANVYAGVLVEPAVLRGQKRLPDGFGNLVRAQLLPGGRRAQARERSAVRSQQHARCVRVCDFLKIQFFP